MVHTYKYKRLLHNQLVRAMRAGPLACLITATTVLSVVGSGHAHCDDDPCCGYCAPCNPSLGCYRRICCILDPLPGPGCTCPGCTGQMFYMFVLGNQCCQGCSSPHHCFASETGDSLSGWAFPCAPPDPCDECGVTGPPTPIWDSSGTCYCAI